MNTKKITSFFIQHPEYAAKIISRHYPLSLAELTKYKAVLKWDYASSNQHIKWTKEIIDTFIEQINWHQFTMNPAAFSDLTLLHRYDAHIDWQGIDDFEGDSITENSGLRWDMPFIESVESKIDFSKLSESNCVLWTEQLIDKYLKRLNLHRLACNESVPWTLPLFEKYLDASYFNQFLVSMNKTLTANVDFVEKYTNELGWYCVFANEKLPWAEMDLMNRWKDNIDWCGVAINETLFKNNSNFFHAHFDKWSTNIKRDFKLLSSNYCLPWTMAFIDNLKHYWDWEHLSSNKGLPWSIELIDHFDDSFIWGGWMPDVLLDENGYEVAPVGGKALVFGLNTNPALPWSIDFLNYYETQLEFEILAENSAVWEKAFRQYVDDTMIDRVLQAI